MAGTTLPRAGSTYIQDDEAELVRAAQNSLAGFQPLYQRWLARVYRYFYFRCGRLKDAEDLTSRVFLKVYEELPRYQERGRFSAWLFTIARRQVIDFYRTQGREVSLEELDPLDGAYDLLTQAIRSDEIQRLHRLVRNLPDEEQELIRLRFVAELSYREIGAVIGRREDAVRKSVSRLLARLQSQLETKHD
ncbi:MAG: RNA polymerase sigma factor [Anaerolineaceae bacterium]|nr:RNA polymerase sigma factor [Anaerolineaceae bacterium]